MKPVEFPEKNVVLGQDQPEYQPLPVFRSREEGEVISCWRFSIFERLKILFGADLWLRQLTFGRPFQPLLPELECPFVRGRNRGKSPSSDEDEKKHEK